MKSLRLGYGIAQQGSKLNPSWVIEDSNKNVLIWDTARLLNAINIPDNDDFLLLSDELLSNHDFLDGDTNWTVGSGWSISEIEEKAHYSAAANGSLLKYCTYMPEGTKIVIEFKISNAPTSAWIQINTGNVGSSPSVTILEGTNYVNGIHRLELTMPANTHLIGGFSGIQLFASKYFGSAFDLEFCSVKYENPITNVSISGKKVLLTCLNDFVCQDKRLGPALNWNLDYVSGATPLKYSNGSNVADVTNQEVENHIDYKKLSIIGDSIDTITSYPCLFDRSMYYVKNHAVAGHSILSNMDGQVAETANDNADIILIKLGTNDNNSGDMGVLQAKIEENIIALKLSNPSATIYYINLLPKWTSTSGTTEVDLSNIRTAISSACLAQNIQVIDTYTTPWITAADTSDGTHLAATGKTKVHNEIIAIINPVV